MPELPEVEAHRRRLERWGAGRRIRRVDVRDRAAIRRGTSTRPSDADPEGADRLAGLTDVVMGPVARHGKRLGFTAGDVGVLAHLGMTGRFVWRDAATAAARIVLHFDDGAVSFEDTRRFGAWAVVDPRELPVRLAAGHGPDALITPLDGPALADRLGGARALHPALLDQARVAGIGNIHAAEALWRARIAPDRAAATLSASDWARLASEVLAQLRENVDALGDEGDVAYLSQGAENPFAVYGRAGAPCPRCGARIVRNALGGRSVYACPACQPGDPSPRT
jgi:formamidopyrimidine-DNA glycosylase